jgi:5-methylcytosine-specific restriction endonuclease McrA
MASIRQQRKKQREKDRKYYEKVKSKTIELLGGKCVACGEDDPRVLQVDHIKPERRKMRDGTYSARQNMLRVLKEPRYAKAVQLLCANCHMKKTAEDWAKITRERLDEISDETLATADSV